MKYNSQYAASPLASLVDLKVHLRFSWVQKNFRQVHACQGQAYSMVLAVQLAVFLWYLLAGRIWAAYFQWQKPHWSPADCRTELELDKRMHCWQSSCCGEWAKEASWQFLLPAQPLLIWDCHSSFRFEAQSCSSIDTDKEHRSRSLLSSTA